jgi:hypothetical protein
MFCLLKFTEQVPMFMLAEIHRTSSDVLLTDIPRTSSDVLLAEILSQVLMIVC